MDFFWILKGCKLMNDEYEKGELRKIGNFYDDIDIREGWRRKDG